MSHKIQVLSSRDGKILYRIGTTTNSKTLIFNRAELSALVSDIHTVLGGTENDRKDP